MQILYHKIHESRGDCPLKVLELPYETRVGEERIELHRRAARAAAAYLGAGALVESIVTRKIDIPAEAPLQGNVKPDAVLHGTEAGTDAPAFDKVAVTTAVPPARATVERNMRNGRKPVFDDGKAALGAYAHIGAETLHDARLTEYRNPWSLDVAHVSPFLEHMYDIVGIALVANPDYASSVSPPPAFGEFPVVTVKEVRI